MPRRESPRGLTLLALGVAATSIGTGSFIYWGGSSGLFASLALLQIVLGVVLAPTALGFNRRLQRARYVGMGIFGGLSVLLTSALLLFYRAGPTLSDLNAALAFVISVSVLLIAASLYGVVRLLCTDAFDSDRNDRSVTRAHHPSR